MKQTFTPNDLIANLYDEKDSLERIELEVALALNPSFSAEHNRLQKAYRELPKAQFVPRPRILSAILKYSRTTRPEATI